MRVLPTCVYGLWTNGTDLVFKTKITGGGRIQPEYVELYDLPGYGETAADMLIFAVVADSAGATFALLKGPKPGPQA